MNYNMSSPRNYRILKVFKRLCVFFTPLLNKILLKFSENLVKGRKVEVDSDYLHVTLEDNRIISTPIEWYPELFKSSEIQRQGFDLICEHSVIEWEEIDFHLSIKAMLKVEKSQAA